MTGMDFEHSIRDYLCGVLPEDQAKEMEGHLRQNPDLGELVDDFGAILEVSNAIHLDPRPEGMLEESTDELLHRIEHMESDTGEEQPVSWFTRLFSSPRLHPAYGFLLLAPIVSGIFWWYMSTEDLQSLAAPLEQLVLVDRQGQILRTIRAHEQITSPAISPDGRMVAVAGTDLGNTVIWLYGIEDGLNLRLTSDATRDGAPAWSPDGRILAFASDRNGTRDLFTRAINRPDLSTLLSNSQHKDAPNWSPDGRFVVYQANNEQIWSISLSGQPLTVEAPVPLRTSSASVLPQISPDGRYIAYQSDETGRWEIYVQPFPDGPGRWQISGPDNGGIHPRWNRSGTELFFIEPGTNTLMATPIDLTGSFLEAERPITLFTGDQIGLSVNDVAAFPSIYDVFPDGQSFVFVRPVE